MAKTLLDGVNEVLKRVNVIAGDSQEFATLTDSPRQHWIDLAVQVWNEMNENLYSLTEIPMPQETTESSITLVADDRDYTLASDLVQLHFPLHDETNGQFIEEFPGGYKKLKDSQSYPANETGLPYWGAISPVDGTLYLDKLPTSVEAGRVYVYRYDKDISMSAASDAFPYTDAVFRAMVPAVAERWREEKQNKMDKAKFNRQFAIAARLLRQTQPRNKWTPARSASHVSDPFHAD